MAHFLLILYTMKQQTKYNITESKKKKKKNEIRKFGYSKNGNAIEHTFLM